MKLNTSQLILTIFTLVGIGVNLADIEFGILPPVFFIVWLIHLLYSVSEGFMVRKIFVLFFSLQHLMGSYLSYQFSAFQTFKMSVDAKEYFQYSFLGIMFLGLGLFVRTKKSSEDVVFSSISKITKQFSIKERPLFIVLFFSLFLDFIGISPPDALAFVFYLFYGIKYAYVCYHIINKEKINYYIISIPILFLAVQSLQIAMFHDLITWSMFWGLSVAMRVKPKISTVILAALSFLIVITVIQLTKASYREKTWRGTSEGGIDTYSETVLSNDDAFGQNSLIENIGRINQGWIVTRVMQVVPSYVQHEDFELINKYLEAAFLPRALAPDKLTAGNKEIFTKYTQHELQKGTSMGLGLISDGWISFGKEGGWAFLFVYGFIISLSLKLIAYNLNKMPLLYYFIPLIYYYPIRPDCETQTSFGHLIKSSMFLYFILFYLIGSKRLKIKEEEESKNFAIT